jgi:hypothetical protein
MDGKMPLGVPPKEAITGGFSGGADAGSTGFFANNLAVASGMNVARMALRYFKTHPR